MFQQFILPAIYCLIGLALAGLPAFLAYKNDLKLRVGIPLSVVLFFVIQYTLNGLILPDLNKISAMGVTESLKQIFPNHIYDEGQNTIVLGKHEFDYVSLIENHGSQKYTDTFVWQDEYEDALYQFSRFNRFLS